MENSQVLNTATKIDNTNMLSMLIAIFSITHSNIGYKEFGVVCV